MPHNELKIQFVAALKQRNRSTRLETTRRTNPTWTQDDFERSVPGPALLEAEFEKARLRATAKTAGDGEHQKERAPSHHQVKVY